MLVLVAGATGRVGGATVRHLLACGVRVRALVRSPARGWVKAMLAQGVELAPADVLRPSSLRSACGGVDVVVCAVTSPGHMAAVEGRGNANLIAAAQRAGARHYLYVSAAGVERAEGVPGLGVKYLVERLLVASGMPWTILRPAALNERLSCGLRGNLALVVGRQPYPLGWIAADDVGRVAAACCGRADVMGTAIAFGGPDLLTFDEAYAELARGRGRPVHTIHVPIGLPLLGRPFSRKLAELAGLMAFLNRYGASVDTGLIERRFGFRPQTVAEWIQDRLKMEP